MSLRLVAAGKTDIGLQREQNEDAFYTQVMDDAHPASGVFIVSDGMGGYHAGEVASKLAVETIRDDLAAIFAHPSDQTTVKLSNRRGRKRAKSGKRDSAKTQPLTDADQEDEGAANADSVAEASAADSAATQKLGAEGDEDEEAGATRHLIESVVEQHFSEKLRAAVEHSSVAIVEYGSEHREARGMGATLTAALVMDGQAFIANVGDSRTYLLREGKLERVTRDHSLVERLVEAGQIDAEDVYDHPSRNLIYRSLGAGHAEVDVDIFVERLRPGDALLLCSDGLWEMVRDLQLQKVITGDDDVEQVCEALVKIANENGGEDNITAVLVRCVEA